MTSAVTVDRDSPVDTWLDRVIAGTVLAAAIGVCFVLLSVTPDARGHGTHEALGMSACGWAQQGYPCPTCGVTTAAAHLVRLSPWRAFVTHPFGAALAGAGLWLAALALWSIARRQSFLARVVRLPYGAIVGAFVVLLMASWLYRYVTWNA